MKILDENKVPATFVANARALEFAPAAAKQAIKSGHEIAAHSYTQDTILAYLTPQEEKALIKRCIGIHRKITGAKPKGWLSPVVSPTANTEGFLIDAGFLWYGDYNNIDLPCRVKT